jgi:hypothetical protein
VAGALYVLVVLTGMFVLLYVPGRLFVHGDAAATAARILEHQTLYRCWTAMGLLSEFLFIAVVLVLFRLLKGVSPVYAALMVLPVLLSAPLAFLSEFYHVATLALLRGGGGFLNVLDEPAREAVALLMLNLDSEGTPVMELFWGLWLIPLGLLVFRSRFLPRLFGVWLVLNGVAYMGLSLIGLLAPQHADAGMKLAMPLLLAEPVFALWLVLAGTRGRSSPAASWCR